MKTNQNKLLALVLSIVMLLSFAACSNQRAKDEKTTNKAEVSTTEAVKTQITIEVVGQNKEKKEFKIDTDEKYLRGALEQENLIKGEETNGMLMVKTVDGYTVDDSKKEWWGIYKDGKMTPKGVDQTEIKNGDKFELRLNEGY